LTVNKNFKDGEAVTPETLLAKGLIKEIKTPVKILGKDRLTVKISEFKGVKMSASVKDQLK